MSSGVVGSVADINARSDSNGATPMHVAVQGNRDEALSILMMRGCDRTLKYDGKTALQLSVNLKHTACERVIVAPEGSVIKLKVTKMTMPNSGSSGGLTF